MNTPPPARPQRHGLALPGSALLCVLALAADIATPRGIATGVMYIAVVFCCRWFADPKSAFAFAGLGSVLTVIGYFFKTPSATPEWMVVTNRALCVGAIWLTALLVYLSRRAERRARENERQSAMLAAIVNSSDDAIISKNLDGVIESWNRGAERIFGYAAEEAIGRHISLLIPNERREEENYIIGRIRQGVPVEHYETVRLRKDGAPIHVSLTVSPVHDASGRVTGASKIARDVTARAKLEEERQRMNEILEARVAERTRELAVVNKELEEFAYIASHDLKAPLRVIDNASKWLEEDLQEHLTDDTRESLGLLRGRVTRMEKLLDDLLNYSRIGRKEDGQYTEGITGGALMEDVLALLSPPEGFTVRVDPEFASLSLTRMPLQQILHNLVNNAIKHHDRKNGAIQVSAEDAGGHYVITVKDDGPGIPHKFQETIFKMFTTLKPRDQVEGSGMGLAVVKKHVEHYGGRITVESEEGKGSAFRFTWPKQAQRKEAA